MIKTFNRMVTWALAIAIVVLLVFAGFKHFSKPPSHVREMMEFKEMLKEGEPAFTTQEAEAFTKELIPLVEEAAGAKFKQIPKIRLIGRDTLANVLMQDLLPQLINLMPGTNSVKILEMAENQAKGMTPLIIGKYGFMDQVLYLIPGNVYGPKFISTVENIAINNAKKLKNSKMYHMENLNFENFSGLNADVGRRLSYTLRPANGSDVQVVAVRICIGNMMLEILDSNIGLENEGFIKIAELIFKRWQLFNLSYQFSRPFPFDLNSELLEAV